MSEYEVEKILAVRSGPKGQEFQIKWKGYSITESTWEPERNLSSCRDMVQEFKKTHGLDPKPKPRPMAIKTVKFKDQKEARPIRPNKSRPTQEDPEEEEPTEAPESLKRANPQPVPAGRKSVRVAKPSGGALGVRSVPSGEEQVQAQVPAQLGRRGGEGGPRLQVLGLYQDRNGSMIFKVSHNKGKTELLTREEVLETDPVALVVFYEINLKIIKK